MIWVEQRTKTQDVLCTDGVSLSESAGGANPVGAVEWLIQEATLVSLEGLWDGWPPILEHTAHRGAVADPGTARHAPTTPLEHRRPPSSDCGSARPAHMSWEISSGGIAS
jgi:hypothetical protein